jgi:hypothetical protein
MMERERLEPLDYTVIQLAANESWLPTDSWPDLRGYLIGKDFDPEKVESSKLRLMRLLSDARSLPPSPPHANGFDLGPNAKSLQRDSETDQVSNIGSFSMDHRSITYSVFSQNVQIMYTLRSRS